MEDFESTGYIISVLFILRIISLGNEYGITKRVATFAHSAFILCPESSPLFLLRLFQALSHLRATITTIYYAPTISWVLRNERGYENECVLTPGSDSWSYVMELCVKLDLQCGVNDVFLHVNSGARLPSFKPRPKT